MLHDFFFFLSSLHFDHYHFFLYFFFSILFKLLEHFQPLSSLTQFSSLFSLFILFINRLGNRSSSRLNKIIFTSDSHLNLIIIFIFVALLLLQRVAHCSVFNSKLIQHIIYNSKIVIFVSLPVSESFNPHFTAFNSLVCWFILESIISDCIDLNHIFAFLNLYLTSTEFD